MLTTCELKAKSVAHVEQRIVSGCVCVSLVVMSRGSTELLRLLLSSVEAVAAPEEEDEGNSSGVGGLSTGLDSAELSGVLLRDGTASALGVGLLP